MTMRHSVKAALLAATFGLTLVLAGCGGGGGDDTPAPPVAETNEVPSSAAASTAAWLDYAASLPESETERPKTLGTIEAPTSETDLPQAL